MHGKTILFIIIISVLVTTCKKNALFLAGDNATGTVQLEPFDKIEIKDVFDIVLISDTIDYITIECGENLLPNIEVAQENTLIYLYNHNKYHWSREYENVNLEIHSTSLKTITIREPITLNTRDTFKMESISITDWSKISIVDMTVDVNHLSLGVSASNTGDYTLRGRTNTCSFRAWGSCFYFANQLEANACTVRHDGIGDVYVNVKNKLTVRLNTYGNVYYKGSPQLDVEKYSSGSLINLD